MEIRLAHPKEVSAIMEMISGAQAFLAQSGSDQWQNGYPSSDIIIDDILESRGYVGIIEGHIVAYAAVYQGNEAAYNKIYDGKWKHNNKIYVTFHRVAVNPEFRGQKVAQTFLQGLIEGHKGPDFRIDTHEKNLIMQHIAEKLGFVYCGKVPLDGERLAYQKIKGKSETAHFQEMTEDDRWMVRTEESMMAEDLD
ncbi:GNAT family N-acetyltransferase [Streptococcus sp. X16XC17]|uniref:GNAT family N-acetyltransferase n=1 Tax=unclassified Streptococcus TaxID=2608887 RepID=UPI00066FEDF2|nr:MULTISPECIES: GNAT family N-acetyltransferase [unclassified Streptococcus]TCD46629.1 GNAT family N-acetyltransferase [Streptococcus sp. X16XC17]